VSDIVEKAVEIGQNFRPDGFAVETNQFQSLLADEMNRLACARRLWLPIFGFENHIPKAVRIRRLTKYLTRGVLRFKGNSAGARLVVRQLRDFPNGDHDDGPDALEMAVRLSNQLGRGAAEPEPVMRYEYLREIAPGQWVLP